MVVFFDDRSRDVRGFLKVFKIVRCWLVKFAAFAIVLFFISIFPKFSYADCNPGCYVSGTTCQPCTTGTWSAGGSATSCTACPAGQTGIISTGATSCIAYKTLKSSTGKLVIIRAAKNTTPSLCIKDTNTTYYGDLSSAIAGNFKLNFGGTVYNVVEPTGLAAANCGTPNLTGLEGEPFKVTLTGITAGSAFSFQIGASGNFTIDWGDNTAVQSISNKPVDTGTTYSHTYTATGNYVVTIGGKATGYTTAVNSAAITFANSTNKVMMTQIVGDLGSVFPILNDTDAGKPQFYATFSLLTGMTGSIPPNLFAGLHGSPGQYMFCGTFNCNNGGIGAPTPTPGCFHGPIPENLFSGVIGSPTNSLFASEFFNCTNLTGNIPENLFSSVRGAPTPYLFSNTFAYTSGLTGSIPENLFAGIVGAPTQLLFYNTFIGDTGLTGPIPENLFSGIRGAPTSQLFMQTFSGCTGLTGIIPGNLFAGIVDQMPGLGEFNYTFQGCTGLTGIGDGLFNGISGLSSCTTCSSFYGTFAGASNLTGPSAKSGGQFLYQKWPTAATGQVGKCYNGTTKL